MRLARRIGRGESTVGSPVPGRNRKPWTPRVWWVPGLLAAMWMMVASVAAETRQFLIEGSPKSLDRSQEPGQVEFRALRPSRVVPDSWTVDVVVRNRGKTPLLPPLVLSFDQQVNVSRDLGITGVNSGGVTFINLSSKLSADGLAPGAELPPFTITMPRGSGVPSVAGALYAKSVELFGPVAVAQSVTTDEDAAVSLVLSGTDADGDALTFTVVTSPSRGVLTGTAPNLTYTPNPNAHGTDRFTFKVNDGRTDSSVAAVTVLVRPVNDVPVAAAQTVAVAIGAARSITLAGSDVDGDALSFAVVTPPTQGVLSGTAPNLTYTANPNATGADNFTFKVNDGRVDSPVATVAIEFGAGNRPPVAIAQTVTADEDIPKAITLAGSDADGNALTHIVVSPPNRGTLSGTAPNLIYTPNPNAHGADSFTFKVNDGTVDSPVTTVSITVRPVNDVPGAAAQTVAVASGAARSITLAGSDVDGDALSFAVVTPPTQGVLSGTAPNLTYTANPNATGADNFTFKVNDGRVDSPVATVAIEFGAGNRPPVAIAQTVTADEDIPKSITLAGSDADGNALTHIVVSPPNRGTLSGTAPNLTYTPNPNAHGVDSFTFKVNDGTVDSPVTTVSITVRPVNDAPLAVAQTVAVASGAARSITLAGSDVDGDALSFAVVTPPTKGVLSGTAPNLTYTANPNATGADNFTFKVNDGRVDSPVATVAIELRGGNRAPVAFAQTVGTDAGTAKAITLAGSDADGDALTFSVATPPTKGVLSGSGPNLTYTPDSNSTGPDGFAFRVNDGVADSPVATVAIDIGPVNSTPEAQFAAARSRTLDASGQPLGGVAVRQRFGEQVTEVFSDPATGFVALGGAPGDYLWRFSREGYLTIWRKATLAARQATFIPSSWMVRQQPDQHPVSPLRELALGGPGGTPASIVFPAGALTVEGAAGFTAIGPQSLPLPLPPGWSPLGAFHLSLPAEPVQPGTATWTPLDRPVTGDVLVMLKYDPTRLEWTVLAQPQPVARPAGPVGGSGTYALVVADRGALAPPASVVGSALTGTAGGVPDPSEVAASGSVDPARLTASLDPVAMTATGKVVFSAPRELASGAWFRTEIEESHQLTTGKTRRSPLHDTSFFAYQRPGDADAKTLHASFPLRPFRLLAPDQVEVARVKVDILTRESFAGSIFDTTGGRLASGDLSVSASAGDLVGRSIVELRPLDVAGFESLLSGAKAEAAFHLAVGRLAPGRTLGVGLGGMAPNRDFVVARQVTLGEVEGLEPVERFRSDAQGQIRSVEPSGGLRLPGVQGSGQYVVVAVEGPQAVVQGVAQGVDGAPAGGLVVRLQGLPWLTFSAADGSFRLVAPRGADATLQTTDPRDANIGSRTVSVAAQADPAPVDVRVASTAPRVVATVPADGAQRVRSATPVSLTFSEPIDLASFGADAVTLTNPLGVVVPGAVLLDPSGTEATFLPNQPLEHAATYTIGLKATIRDRQGLVLQGPRSFRFSVIPFFERDPGAQMVIYEPGAARIPDAVKSQLVGYSSAQGSSHVVVHGSAGTADPEVPVILVNQNTGATATVLSKPDGSFASFIQAAQEDFIEAVFVNGNGTRITVPATRQIYDNGRIGLYKYGGILEAQSDGGPVQIQIEPQAIKERTVFKVDVISVQKLAELTKGVLPSGGAKALPGISIAIDQGETPTGDAEVSIPLDPTTLGLDPGVNPEDAGFALTLPVEVDGTVVYVTVDKMRYEKGRLFTNTCPFKGVYSANIADNVIAASANFLGPSGLIINFAQMAIPVMVSAKNGGITVNGSVAQLPISDLDKIEAVSFQQLALLPLSLGLSGAASVPLDLLGSVGDLVEQVKSGGAVPVRGALVSYRVSTNVFGEVTPGLVCAISDEGGCYSLVVPTVFGNVSFLSASHPRLGRARDVGLSILDLLDIGSKKYLARNIFFGIEDEEFARVKPTILVSQVPESPAVGQEVSLQVDVFTAASVQTSVMIGNPSLKTLVLGQEVTAGDLEKIGEPQTQGLAPGHSRTTAKFRALKSLDATVRILAKGTSSRLGTSATVRDYVMSFGFSRPVISNPLPVADPTDKEAPRVVRVSPRSGDHLYPGQPVQIVFSEPIDQASLQAPDAANFSGQALGPAKTLSADQRVLTVSRRDPSASAGAVVTLTLGGGIKDLSGNTLSPSKSISYRSGSMQLTALPGGASGGGSVLDGAFCYVLDRSSPGRVRIFDVSDPNAPFQVGDFSEFAAAAVGATFSAIDFPRDLVLIRDWSHVPGVDESGKPLAATRRTLLAIVGGKVGAGATDSATNRVVQSGQYLTLLDVSNPASPVLVQNVQLTLRPSTVPKIVWRPPFLHYLENSADTHFVGKIDLQELLIGFSVPRARRAEVLGGGRAGVDVNGDGDYTDADPGEQLPFPNLQEVTEFMGFRGAYEVLPHAAQRVEDFDIEGGALAVVRSVSGLAPPIPPTAAPEFRLLSANNQDLPPQSGFHKFSAGARPKRLALAPRTKLTDGRMMNLAFVSLAPDHDGRQKIAVIDWTDISNPVPLRTLPIPDTLQLGVLQSPVLGADGLLRVSTTTHVLLLDPSRVALPASTGPDDLHACIVGIQPGGSGNVSIGVNASGLRSIALGGRNEVLQGPPAIDFVQFPSADSVVAPRDLATLGAPSRAELLSGMISTTALRPVRRRAPGNTPEGNWPSLSPASPLYHYHVAVRAPGGAGVTLPLLLESLNEAGTPLRAKGKGFPPIRAADSAAFNQPDGPATDQDASVRSLKAYRVSNDKSDPYYNLYLSEPIAVMREGINKSDLDTLCRNPSRVILWSEHAVRVSLDTGVPGALAPFASEFDTFTASYRPKITAIASTLPGGFVPGSTPPPIGGEFALPGTFGTIDAASGEFRHATVDLQMPSPRMDVVFERKATSHALVDSGFGRGWDFNYNQRLIELTPDLVLAGEKIAITERGGGKDVVGESLDIQMSDGAGNSVLFKHQGKVAPLGVDNDPLVERLGWKTAGGEFYLPASTQPGVFDLIYRYPDGQKVRLTPDGTQFLHRADGRLAKIIDRYPANSQVMEYDSAGHLVAIVDKSVDPARKLRLGYHRTAADPDLDTSIDKTLSGEAERRKLGLITSLTDFAGRRVDFEYNAEGMLERRLGVEVTGANGGFSGRPKTEYLIDTRTKSYVGIRAGTGSQQGGTPMIAATTSPNAAGEAVPNKADGAGGSTEIRVPADRTASNVSAEPTGATHADDSTTSVSFDANGYPAGVRLGGAGTTPAAVYDTDYNAQGLPEKVTYPEGNSVTYTYEFGSIPFRARANVIKVVRDPGPRGGLSITTEASYDYTFNEPSGQQRDANGKASTITLDAEKRHAVRIDYGSAGVLTISRDANGRVLSQTSPDGVTIDHVYDAASGYPTSETRGGSVTTRFFYDATVAGRLGSPTTITPPRGAPIVLVYDANLQRTSMTRGGLVEKTGYDENGNVVFVSRALGDGSAYEETREYSQISFLKKRTVRRIETGGASEDLVTVFTPDPLFRVKQMFLPGQEIRTITYNHLGHVIKAEIGSYSEEFTRDLHGNVTVLKRGGDEVQRTTHDGHDRPIVVETLTGSGTDTSTLTYFDGGQLKTLKVEGPVGGVVRDMETTGVDELGRPLGVTLYGTAVSATTTVNYQGTKTTTLGPIDKVTVETDAAGRPSTHRDALRSVTFTVDGNGNVEKIGSVEEGTTFTRDMEYDGLDHLKKTHDPVGTLVEITSLRTDGLPLVVQDGRNKTIRRSYSRLGELLALEKPEQLKFAYAFDKNRQATKVSDRGDKGNETGYDPTLRPNSVTWRDGSMTSFSDFDGRNRPKSIALPGGGAVTASYDLQGRPTRLDTRFSGSNYQFKDATYDALGRLRSAKYGADGRHSVSYGYDKLGPLTSVTYDEPGGPYPITTGIRSDGARTSLTYPSGITVSETRDDGGRLTKVAISSASLWEATSFAGAELPAVVRRGAVITETSAYDARKRLLSRRYTGAGETLLEDVRVAYDGADNVTARQLLAGGGRADLFEYDDANRLIRAEYGARPGSASVRSGTGLVGGPGLSAGVHARTYAYDGGGLDLLVAATAVNPDGVPDQATSAMPLNRPSFASSLGGHDGFLFARTVDGFARGTDALGNTARTLLLLRPSVGAAQPVAADLNYNGAGNLVRITRTDGVTIEMQYRPDKTLHHRQVIGGAEPSETALVWHEGRLLEEYDLAGGNRVLRGRYYYANGDPPVAADLRQADGSLLRVHYLHDHAMSVVAAANEAGEVLERARYDAWGQPVLLMRDTTPAAISEIRQDGNSLLVTLSEPVLQVPDQAPGKDLVTSVPGTLADAFELTVNGTVLKPQVVFEEGLAPFGSVFRLSGFPANTVGAMTVRVVGGKLVDTFGTLVADARMPFGLSPVPATGVPVGSTCSVGSRSAIGNPWLWQGQWFDYDAGLVYMRARHYDPQTGQFLQRDPMQYEDSVNLYAAMANNPVSYRDPTGMISAKVVSITGKSASEARAAVAEARRAIQVAESVEDAAKRLLAGLERGGAKASQTIDEVTQVNRRVERSGSAVAETTKGTADANKVPKNAQLETGEILELSDILHHEGRDFVAAKLRSGEWQGFYRSKGESGGAVTKRKGDWIPHQGILVESPMLGFRPHGYVIKWMYKFEKQELDGLKYDVVSDPTLRKAGDQLRGLKLPTGRVATGDQVNDVLKQHGAPSLSDDPFNALGYQDTTRKR
jgi:RHS repeat-associated protein